MKVEIIKSGDDWLLISGSGSILAEERGTCGDYEIPRRIEKAICKEFGMKDLNEDEK